MGTPPGATTDAIPPVIAVSALAPGAMVAGRYRLEARLGAGGGGTVWRCIDDKLGATVALKIVSPGGDLERWRREVAMARRIADRNVCRVHDLGETAELRYVTMELVEGDGLRARIAGELPAGTARDLFAQIVAGTAAIHGAGVVHRDLKPENVVVARDGRAVIVDFGLAREPRGDGAASGASGAASGASGAAPDGGASTVQLRGPVERVAPSGTVTHTGTVVGTPRYMSPEQAAGEPVGPRTDVWALGLIGHELLTGALPAHDDDGDRRVDPAVDAAWPGVAGVLRRCLAAAPEARFADARALAQALAAIGRRRRVARWAVAAVVVVAAIGGGIVTVRAVRRIEPSHPTAPPRMYQLTTAEPKKWPAQVPISVALSPDATRFAYTTADGRLLVRPVSAGAAVAWAMPALEKPHSRPTDAPESLFAAMWAVGWFSDGSIALVGSSRDGYQLDRVYPDGRTQLLYRAAQRFTTAVTPVGDRVVIGISEQAMFVIATAEGAAPDQIATLGRGEQVTALAWSPDGARIACARLPAEASQDASIQVMSATGEAVAEVWRGPPGSFVGPLLAWIGDDRLAVASSDLVTGRSRLVTVDVASRASQLRDEWPGTYVGTGSAARGTLLLLRGTATYAVQIGDHTGWHLARVHDPGVRARQVAGWTSDGHVVFAAGAPGRERIVRAAPGQALDSWPGTHDGVESPDTLVGDDVITHRLDDAARQVVVERITPGGEHTELARLPAHAAGGNVVRCAGDRVAPCVLEETDARLVSWTELDPQTGARGPRLHQRPIRAWSERSAALSPDGQLLAIVDGGETVTVIDRKTGLSEMRSAGEGAVLQSVGFAPDGDLWATAIGFHGKLFGLMTFDKLTSGRLSSMPSTRGNTRTDALRWFGRPSPSADGKQVAVGTLDLALEVWRADGL